MRTDAEEGMAKGCKARTSVKKKEHAGTFQTANLDHSLGYRDISLQNQKDSG
jgi:hypothetical protein